jgi:hypothetical protein
MYINVIHNIIEITSTVGANVGIQLPKLRILNMKLKTINSKRTRGEGNVNSIQSPPTHREFVGLFIGEINDRFTLFELSLTNHYISKVHNLRGITDNNSL